jgi:hypothetical protein
MVSTFPYIDDGASFRQPTQVAIGNYERFGHIVIDLQDHRKPGATRPELGDAVLSDFLNADTPAKLLRYIERYGFPVNRCPHNQELREHFRELGFVRNCQSCDSDKIADIFSGYQMRKTSIDQIIKTYGLIESGIAGSYPADPNFERIRHYLDVEACTLLNNYIPLERIVSMRKLLMQILLTKELLDSDSLTQEAIIQAGFSFAPVPYNNDGRCFVINYETETDDINAYTHVRSYRQNSGVFQQAELREGLWDLLDATVSCQLEDVKLESRNGQEFFVCHSLQSSIWVRLFDAFRGGRVGRCEICKKPYISKMERGEPRKYCSERCRKRAQRGSIGNKRGQQNQEAPPTNPSDQ